MVRFQAGCHQKGHLLLLSSWLSSGALCPLLPGALGILPQRWDCTELILPQTPGLTSASGALYCPSKGQWGCTVSLSCP